MVLAGMELIAAGVALIALASVLVSACYSYTVTPELRRLCGDPPEDEP